ncbi:superoxide dismutase [Amycolatopsis anabasis]|uniref:superoxide dismutase n=1 Tax=Amycolatopsis anabasis TaxID=1840409 RepID=UPI00131E2399|nr:superoxide dismutase [Amycolatopsis anabasis]
MRRVLGVVLTLLALVLPVPAVASPGGFPAELALPDGFQPEGIAIGAWPTAYFGSRADGRIHRIDLRTGRGRELSPATGTPSLGIKVDSAHGRLFVAGGTGGDARVIDARTGAVLARYAFATGDTFVNDLVLTRDAVWFTDSRQAALYQLPLGRHGELPGEFTRLPLTGDLVVVPGAVNANGIVTTPDGRALLIGQSNTGKLFRVDPATGVTRTVDLGGEALPNNDGLLREGTRLYVVQNRLNLLAKLELAADGGSARVVERRTDPGFDVPATVAAWRNRFYLVNARFTTPPTPSTTYSAVAIDRF